jgi:starch phosphorylase
MKKKLPKVAYFCMEYGLHEEFNIYSGGLGILAGDYIKAGKDGDYPLVGIGIIVASGYIQGSTLTLPGNRPTVFPNTAMIS